MKELLIGCGSKRNKRVSMNGQYEWSNLTTLDLNPDHKPDLVYDLMNLPLPFGNDVFDEIHAYEVLEHIGSQGDYKTFFNQFSEFWRILKPDGFFCATVPSVKSPWAWADPSHSRVIPVETLVFLDQDAYTQFIGNGPMSDFRYLYKSDFRKEFAQDDDTTLAFALRAIKPSRISI